MSSVLPGRHVVRIVPVFSVLLAFETSVRLAARRTFKLEHVNSNVEGTWEGCL